MTRPFLCRFGHSLPPVFVHSYWGGVSVYERLCRRPGCGHVHRIGEVEFERKYLGR